MVQVFNNFVYIKSSRKTEIVLGRHYWAVTIYMRDIAITAFFRHTPNIRSIKSYSSNTSVIFGSSILQKFNASLSYNSLLFEWILPFIIRTFPVDIRSIVACVVSPFLYGNPLCHATDTDMNHSLNIRLSSIFIRAPFGGNFFLNKIIANRNFFCD